jgi:hypothetical protein
MTVRTVRCEHKDNIKDCPACWEKFTGERNTEDSNELDEVEILWALAKISSSEYINGDEAKKLFRDRLQSNYILKSDVEKIKIKTVNDICGIACDKQRDAWINGEAFMMAISRYKENNYEPTTK